MLDWENDSLKVGIARSNRNYNVVPEYDHVFSNPIQPILSLALHCCVNKNILNFQSKLFRSNSSEIEQVIKFFLDECKEIQNTELSRALQVLNSGNPLDDLEEMRTSAAKAWNTLWVPKDAKLSNVIPQRTSGQSTIVSRSSRDNNGFLSNKMCGNIRPSTGDHTKINLV